MRVMFTGAETEFCVNMTEHEGGSQLCVTKVCGNVGAAWGWHTAKEDLWTLMDNLHET